LRPAAIAAGPAVADATRRAVSRPRR